MVVSEVVDCGVDVTDCGVLNDIVFTEQSVERPAWTFCGRKLPRSEVVFITQVFLIIIVTLFCVYKLTSHISCDEATIYIALLSSCGGYLIPAPNRGKPSIPQ